MYCTSYIGARDLQFLIEQKFSNTYVIKKV